MNNNTYVCVVAPHLFLVYPWYALVVLFPLLMLLQLRLLLQLQLPVQLLLILEPDLGIGMTTGKS